MKKLEYTGERLIPGMYGKIAVEHLHRYAITLGLVEGKNVLDIACGEGYGSNLLADYANHVTGVDVSEDVILHAKTAYQKENLEFKKGNVLDIPLEKETYDLVISFETLEHVSDHQKMISEIKRVLKPEGILIISTPEKSVYSDHANYSNPYHEKELYEEDFIYLINRNFDFNQFYFQKYLTGSLILSSMVNEERIKLFSGDFNSLDLNKKPEREFLIAICSNKKVASINSDSFFTSGEIDENLINMLAWDKIRKIKSGFRYRLIDLLFKPWDLLKNILR